jgi:SM-20-related protein
MTIRSISLLSLLAALLLDGVSSFVTPSAAFSSSKRQTPLLHLSSQQTQTLLPRISQNDLQSLTSNGYVTIDNFLPESLQESLRQDVQTLRKASQFNVAKIGQDSTNTLNTEIRVAETCFLGPTKLKEIPDASRSQLYDVLDHIRQDLPKQPLDTNLSEFLYAYYPKGGFYRRHRDAIPGSASVLRKYSLLLYLNKDWNEDDGGRLRMHKDSGGDFLPEGQEANYMDVDPKGGTLVLFESDQFPHEVLDTQAAERIAIVGWYNRPVTASDIAELSGETLNPARLAALAIAAALVTVGLVNLL